MSEARLRAGSALDKRMAPSSINEPGFGFLDLIQQILGSPAGSLAAGGMVPPFGVDKLKSAAQMEKIASKAHPALPAEFQQLDNVIKLRPDELSPTDKLIELLQSMGLTVK